MDRRRPTLARFRCDGGRCHRRTGARGPRRHDGRPSFPDDGHLLPTATRGHETDLSNGSSRGTGNQPPRCRCCCTSASTAGATSTTRRTSARLCSRHRRVHRAVVVRESGRRGAQHDAAGQGGSSNEGAAARTTQNLRHLYSIPVDPLLRILTSRSLGHPPERAGIPGQAVGAEGAPIATSSTRMLISSTRSPYASTASVTLARTASVTSGTGRPGVDHQ